MNRTSIILRAVALGASVAVAAAACSGAATPSPSPSPPPASASAAAASTAPSVPSAPPSATPAPVSGSITFLVSSTPTVDNLIKQIPDFEAQTGVKVNVQDIDYDSMTQKETLDLTSKTGQYDVFWTEGTFLGRYVGSLNGLEPLETLAAAQGVDLGLGDVPAQLKANFSYGGKLYAMPFEGTLMMVAYRTDLYAAAKLQPPSTLDQYLADVATLNKPPVYGTEIMGQTGEPIFYEYLNWLWGRGGTLFNTDGSPALDSPQALAAANDLLKLAKSAPPDTANYGWDEAATSFAQGNVSTAVLFSDQTPSLLDPSSSKVVGKWAYAPFPGNDPTAFGGYGWAVNAYSKNKPAALAFVRWATSAKVLSSLVPGGSSPPRVSILTDSALQDQYPWLKAEATAAPRAQVPTADTTYFQLVDALSADLNSALTGGMTVQKALSDAQVKWKQIQGK